LYSIAAKDHSMLCCQDFFWSVLGGLYRRLCATLALAGKRQGRAQTLSMIATEQSFRL
jgi:hypothetical protein